MVVLFLFVIQGFWIFHPKPFPRGEGGPPERKRGNSGSEEECGRKTQSQYNISDLLAGWS